MAQAFYIKTSDKSVNRPRLKMPDTYTMITILLILAFCSFLFLNRWRSNRDSLFTDWPILRMLPSLLCNSWQIHEYFTYSLKKTGGTAEFIGPPFAKMNSVITCDPRNVHYITTKNFSNFGKGPNFRDIFEILGDGIFASDLDTWKYNRDLLHCVFKQKSFITFLEKTILEELESGLIPVLDHFQKQGTMVDLQDIFSRLTFDNICNVSLGFNPHSLSIDFPEIMYQRAIDENEEAIFYRHMVPTSYWKLQKWLGVGKEGKATESYKFLDSFLNEFVRYKKKIISKCSSEMDEARPQDIFTLIFMEELKRGKAVSDVYLKETALNVMAAGRDTITSGLTWFFWLLSLNPLAEAKILDEIKTNFPDKDGKHKIFGAEDVKKLVYLHAAMCESLRLYPPLPLEHKQNRESDTLPSGHHVRAKTRIIYSLYAMGRLEEIWGEDCLEYKPERWISKSGGIAYVPSYKFIAFNAGPRSCLGKEISFMEMKMVASTILWNYQIEVTEGQSISPSLSIILFMKHGLKVSITKRVIN